MYYYYSSSFACLGVGKGGGRKIPKIPENSKKNAPPVTRLYCVGTSPKGR